MRGTAERLRAVGLLVAFSVGIAVVVAATPDTTTVELDAGADQALGVDGGDGQVPDGAATTGAGSAADVSTTGDGDLEAVGSQRPDGIIDTGAPDALASDEPGVGAETALTSPGDGSSAPGVSADSIRLGIGISDLGAIGALGPGYDQGEPREHIEAILTELRATGRHVLHVLLSGSPINGSPVTWYVKAGGPFVNRCRVLPPSGYSAEKPLTANTPYVVTAIAVDKYGRDLDLDQFEAHNAFVKIVCLLYVSRS